MLYKTRQKSAERKFESFLNARQLVNRYKNKKTLADFNENEICKEIVFAEFADFMIEEARDIGGMACNNYFCYFFQLHEA